MMARRLTAHESEVPVGERRAEMAVGKPGYTWFAFGGSRPEACSIPASPHGDHFPKAAFEFERTNNTAGSFNSKL
jgi:hypothetical protein